MTSFVELLDAITEGIANALPDLVTEPLTPQRLGSWARDDIGRTTFLSGSLWTSIRWRRSLGVPDTASPADGFRCFNDDEKIEYVTLIVRPVRIWSNRLVVTRSDTPWSDDQTGPPPATTRRFEPPWLQFSYIPSLNVPGVLPPFEYVARFIF